MRKIVFLDFDGVLNSHSTCLKKIEFEGFTGIDPENSVHMARFLELAGPDTEVVVSSTWRFGRTPLRLEKILKIHGVKATVVDVTPRHFGNRRRGSEIQEWLDNNNCDPKDTAIVIIDDNDDMDHLMRRLVRTDWQDGFREWHIDECLQMLNKPLEE